MKSRAAVVYELEKPEPYAESRPLVVDEVEVAPPQAGEVLVEVAAAGICHSDLSVVNGVRPRPTPMVLGHEASGVVAEVGEGVTAYRPGDHVVFAYVPSCRRCEFCVSGRPALCGPGNQANTKGTLLHGALRFHDRKELPLYHHLGVSAFSHYTVVAEESLVKIDSTVPLDRAAVFGCAVLTGVGAVLNTAQVASGRSVAIFGLGGVGLNAVIGARAAGAWPIVVVDIVESKLTLARELGATHTINSRNQDPVEAIRDLTIGGAHHTFEAVGNEAVFRQAFLSARRGGQVVAIGVAAPDVEYRVPAVSLVGEGKAVIGCYMGSAVPARDVPRFLNMYMAGILPVDKLVTHTIQLDQINEGFDTLARAEAVRQVVVMR